MARETLVSGGQEMLVNIALGRTVVEGLLELPAEALGVVVFDNGSGNSRHSPRNKVVASALQAGGFGTLLLDLLTTQEEALDARTGQLRFDIDRLAQRLAGATQWLVENSPGLPVGYFGAGTGAAAALRAAAELRDEVSAVVSHGGRPDLAGPALPKVEVPVLLIVGERDELVIDLNREAMKYLRHAQEKKLEIIPGATHLFGEPGALERVSELARVWFAQFLPAEKQRMTG